MKGLYILLLFSNLAVVKPLIAIAAHMHNFITKLGKMLIIFKEFAGNRVIAARLLKLFKFLYFEIIY